MRYALIFLFVISACSPKSEQNNEPVKLSVAENQEVAAAGKHIASDTFAALSGKLGAAMQEGGVPYALEFCNVEAMPLTDSLSQKHQVEVRRASHKPRNPSNRADSLEMSSIQTFIAQIEKGEQPKPVLYKHAGKTIFHAPIQIPNQLCLNCHGGEGTDIAQENLELIDKLYPEDEATGFEQGELRGIWAIKFPAGFFDEK